MLENEQYIFAEYTTQKSGIRKKFENDIEKCLDESKTGIEISKIDKIILVCNSDLNTNDIEILMQKCHPTKCDIITNSSLSYDLFNHTPKLVNEFLDIKINETIDKKLPNNINNNIKNSIEREIYNEVFSAITSKGNEIIVLQGEEGIGKTVLSLQIALKLSKNNKYIVRFFKSHEWEQFSNIKELLFSNSENNLEEVLSEEESNIIIFLDGVNERNSLQTAKRLVENFYNLSQEEKSKIKFVFTTRDLTSYSDYKSEDWEFYKTFKLNKFTENELQTAIDKIDSNYDYKDFPNELKEVAFIPRYLNLAFKLKEKFKNYQNITKEMLYWEGLKEQIKNDFKIRELGITEDNDIENILFEVSNSISIVNNIATINKKAFKESFGNDFHKIKTPLLESRIAVGNDIQKVKLNFNMVVIAYAIYLQILFEEVDTSLETVEIADFFKSKLEPYDNDYMSNIPFIAFQISLEKNSSLDKNRLSKIYAGLLYLWFDNHNATIYTENIAFWCKKDFKSYIHILDIIELNYQMFNRPKLKNLMLEILLSRWRNSKAKDNVLKSYLEKIISQNLDFDTENREKLIRRAIKIIFSYPTNDFLNKFLELYKALSKVDCDENLTYIYFLDKYLSILLRFGYKEDIFEYLLENREFDTFSILFKSYELSKKISMPVESYGVSKLSKKIEVKEELLKNFTIEKVHKFYDISFFSFRRDLELNSKDKETIKKTLTDLSNVYMPCKSAIRDKSSDVDIYFLKLLASFDIESFNRLNQKFLYEAIKQKALLRHIEKFDLYLLPNSNMVEFIIENLDFLLKFEDEQERRRYIDKLIEIILFSADDESMLKFFDLLIDKTCSVCLLRNTMNYIKAIGGNKLLSLLKNKIEIYHFKNLNNTKLYESYMTYLFILEDNDNTYLQDWILQIASEHAKKGEQLKEFYAEIFVTVLPVNQYFNKFNTKEMFPSNGNYLTYWVTSVKGFLKEKAIEELLEFLPIDTLGKLLYKNERHKDINKWGITLFEKYNSMSSNKYLGLKEPLELFLKNNKKLFLDYAIKYLNQITNIAGIIFSGGLKDELLELLLEVDFNKAVKLYENENRKNLDNNIMQNIFNLKKFNNSKHKNYREHVILNAKTDLEFMQIVIMAFKGKAEKEVFAICMDLLKSKYSTDRLKTISMLMWLGTTEVIEILNDLISNDDSDYVRKYALWAKEVALQEKYTKEIFEEAIYEDNKIATSAKLNQIRDSITPTFNYWGNEIIKKYCKSNKTKLDRIYKKKFLDRTEDLRKITKEFKINDRKLSEYYCGEKLDNNFNYILNING